MSNLAYQKFTANGTWTAPPGVTQAWLVGCGGGGGGAASYNGVPVRGGGGGGGASLQNIRVDVVPGTAYPITVGAGGQGGTNNGSNNPITGSTGSSTTFGGLASFLGGGGGTLNVGVVIDGGAGLVYADYATGSFIDQPQDPGGGGTGGFDAFSTVQAGVISYQNFAGGAAGAFTGGAVETSTHNAGGGGGGGPFGVGAAGGGVNTVTPSPGAAAAANTGAGGGGASNGTGGAQSGGNGGSGLLYVFWLQGNQASQTFLSSGTWTCPPGVSVVLIECCGGGGGGGSSASNGCGGGGARKQQRLWKVTPGVTYTINIGAGGAAGAAGGSTQFLWGSTLLFGGLGAGFGTNGTATTNLGTDNSVNPTGYTSPSCGGPVAYGNIPSTPNPGGLNTFSGGANSGNVGGGGPGPYGNGANAGASAAANTGAGGGGNGGSGGSGKLLLTWWPPSRVAYQEFFSSGTFIAPPGVSAGLFYGYGGGGGCAAGGSATGAGSIDFMGPITLVPGTSYSVTVGAGGTAGAVGPPFTAGGNGGSTAFGAQISLMGGSGGSAGLGNTSGAQATTDTTHLGAGPTLRPGYGVDPIALKTPASWTTFSGGATAGSSTRGGAGPAGNGPLAASGPPNSGAGGGGNEGTGFNGIGGSGYAIVVYFQ